MSQNYDPEYGDLITDHFVPGDVPELSYAASQARSGVRKKWQIRLLSERPWIIQDAEVIETADFREVMARCGLLVHRVSWVQKGPNREVCWAIDEWHMLGREDGTWKCRMSGKAVIPKRVGAPR